MILHHLITLMILTSMISQRATARPIDDILNSYQQAALTTNPGFKGFNRDRGRQFYLSEHESGRGKVSCATCHTPDPTKNGLTRANKVIDPMAPSKNPDRFTDLKKVEKWFARNCNDVLQRACSPSEKGDFITYMLSIK